MSFLTRIAYILMAIFTFIPNLLGGGIFGGGSSGGNPISIPTSREEALSQEYQKGVWDGSPKGYPVAEVKDGLLFVGGKESDYPADSSEKYFDDCPIVSFPGRGTWFKHALDTRALKLRLDYRGKNLKTIDFTDALVGASNIRVEMSEDGQDILVKYTKDYNHITIHVPANPDSYA